MEREEEQWVQKALESLDGIQPATPPVGMYSNIMQRIQTEKFSIKPDSVHAATIYRAAAAVLLIVTMNVFTCIAISKSVTKEKQLQNFAKQYSLSDTGDSPFNI